MRIGMVLRARAYPPDIRVDKEVRMLQEGGHDCYLLCLNPSKLGEETIANGLHVRYVGGAPQNALARRVNSLLFFASFVSHFARQQCERFICDYAIDALHVHDLPLVGTAHEAAKVRGIPVVADLHENYPEALQEWYGSRLRKATLHNLRLWRRYEARILSQVSHILVVVEESKERILAYGIPEDKISVVRNVTPPDFRDEPLDEQVLRRLAGRFVISYIGGFQPTRGVDVAIRAMQTLKTAIPSVRLLLVGSGPEGYLRELESLVTTCGVQDVVEFTGWRPFVEVPSYIQASEVCLVPLNPGVQTDANGPHKLFQYWMMQKPVVVSSSKSLKRMVESVKGGLVFKAQDPEDLAKCVLSLYQDGELRRSLGINGQQAVLTGDYSWERAAASLNAVYSRLASCRKA